MTATELVSKYVNKNGTIADGEGLAFNVRTKDVRLTGNRVELRVVPVSGHGARWVDADQFQPASASRPMIASRFHAIERVG